MTEPVLFYFDYVSPYAYLANTQLQKLDLEVVYRPIAILEVMEMVHNQPSPKCPAKLQYAMTDTARWASRYAVPLEMNLEWWNAVSDGSLSLRVSPPVRSPPRSWGTSTLTTNRSSMRSGAVRATW